MARYGKQSNRKNMGSTVVYIRMPNDMHARAKDISERTGMCISNVTKQMVEYALEHVQVETVIRTVETSVIGFDGGSKHV